MRYSMIVFMVLMLGCGHAFGSGDDREMSRPAKAFSTAADDCLLDVRDRGGSYETSRNCRNLSGLSLAYINAGGLRPGAPLEHEIVVH